MNIINLIQVLTTCVLAGVLVCTPVNSENIIYPTLPEGKSYCFEYTWIGPDYNNITRYDKTCEDFLDDVNYNTKIPCISPIVISNDSTAPDVDYLWKYHRASVLCIRSESQRCVTYTYKLNGIVTNRTHMCARVKTSGDDISSGCYSETKDGYKVEVCMCKSGVGIHKPCNSDAYTYFLSATVFFLGLFIALVPIVKAM